MQFATLVFNDTKVDFLIPEGSVVTQYPYRTKRVHHVWQVIPRDVMDKIEMNLAELAGKRPDNHTVYEIAPPSGSSIYLMFTDFEVRIGTELVDRRW